MTAPCICLVFEWGGPPNLGTMGKMPPEAQVGGTAWRQPSTPVAIAGGVLALLFAVAAVAAAPTAALRAYLVEDVDAVAVAAGEDDCKRGLAAVGW